MNDPKPLLSGEISPYARSLLVAGKKEAPRASTEDAVLSALGVGAGLAATSLLAASASAARPFYARALKTAWHLVTSKIGIGLIAASAGLGTGWAAGTAHQRDVEREAATIQRPAPAAVVGVAASAPTSVRVAEAPAPDLPVATTVDDSPDVAVASPPRPTPASATAPARKRAPEEAVARAPSPPPEPEPLEPVTAAPPSTGSSLSKELAAIQDARGSILSKDGRAALADVDRYDREHPDGSFAEEALALRVEALRLTGDEEGARKALERLRARYPTSVHLKKLARPNAASR